MRHSRTDRTPAGAGARPADDDRSDARTSLVPSGRPRQIVRGLVAGFVATVTMTVYRLPVFHALPPTAEFWARYVGGGDPGDYPIQAALLHLAYGTAAGGLCGLVVGRFEGRDPDERAVRGLAVGVAYGLALSAFGSRVLLRRLLDLHVDADEALVFHVGHVVYGLTLGTWLGVRPGIGRSSPDVPTTDDGGAPDPPRNA